LRERREDIRPLVAHFLQHYASKMQKPVRGVEERSLRALERYRWPGNVRELENVIEREMVLCSGENLVVREIEMLDVEDRSRGVPRPLAEQLRAVKIETICRALSRTAGNQSRAAEMLGLKPSSLSRMIRALGIGEEEWRRLESGGSAATL
ncbi:MAG: helix-turn-helix domain-containing protein, partial [Candidatus Binatia bacterium]